MKVPINIWKEISWGYTIETDNPGAHTLGTELRWDTHPARPGPPHRALPAAPAAPGGPSPRRTAPPPAAPSALRPIAALLAAGIGFALN